MSGISIFVYSISRRRCWSKYLSAYAIWLLLYGLFIVFGTGPTDLRSYPTAESSAYKLPWKAGVERLVSQGNGSFTSHRDLHFHAWDFLMRNGTEVLAARSGEVIEVVDQFDGIGLKSNFIKIAHEDGTKAMYAHIRLNSSLVNVGEGIKQGQPIAYSGMVGQTIYPHLHFVVFNKDESASIPISFSDVHDGVPFAGHLYTSQNSNLTLP